MKKVFVFILIALFAISFNSCDKLNIDPENNDTLGLSANLPEGWVAEIVDSVEDAFYLADLNKVLVDENNGVHIIYSIDGDSDYDLKYAYKPYGGTWKLSDITSGEYFDLYYGADFGVTNTTVYVVYSDTEPNSRMHLAKMNIGGTTWSDEIFDDNSLSRYPSIFVDKNDVVHIAYTHANYGQYYAQYGSAGTEISDISSSANDIVVDKDGVIHIFYPKNYDFHHLYSIDNGTNWTDDIIYTEPDENILTISAAVDTAGNISAGFSTNAINDNIDFFYKGYNDNNFSFSKTGLDRVGRLQFSLAVDLSGKQYFTTYENSSEFCILFAQKEKTASTWAQTLLLNDEEFRYGDVSDIFVDKDYGIHISTNGYSNEVRNKLYYLYKVHE